MNTDVGGRGLGVARGWYAIGVFVALTLFGYVDRQVFVLLAEPIKHELALSDLQIGLLQGVGLALCGALASYPIGALADRFDRRWVLLGCIGIWGGAVLACGFARSFPMLLGASALVGIGEAGLLPIVYAAIPGLVCAARRQLANSIFTMATQLGIGLATALCALAVSGVAAHHEVFASLGLSAFSDWRLTLVVVALPTPIFAILLATLPRLTASDGPARITNRVDAAEPSALGVHVRAHWQALTGFAMGIGLAAFGFASIMNWIPQIAMRLYGLPVAQVGATTGTATVIATVLGFGFGAPLVQFLSARLGARSPILILAFSTFGSAIASATLLLTKSPEQIFLLQGVQYSLTIGGFLVYPTVTQDLAPPTLRARVGALVSVVRLLCVAASPVVVGAISDTLGSRANGLLLAAAGVSALSLSAAAGLLWWCARHYMRVVVTEGSAAAAPAEATA